MFFVRFALLAFLAAFSFSMGQQPASQLNGLGAVIAGSFFLWAPLLYLLPTYEAWKNGHPSRMAIAILNVLAGWTGLGWVAAAVWAFTRPGVAARAE